MVLRNESVDFKDLGQFGRLMWGIVSHPRVKETEYSKCGSIVINTYIMM